MEVDDDPTPTMVDDEVTLMLAEDQPTLLAADNESTVRSNQLDDPEPATARTTRLETLLFGLSLAVALPPTAMMVSPSAARPAVQSEPHPLLDSIELAAILDRPTTEVGRGRIGLAEIDQRLHRLVVSLGVYQVTDGGGVLVCLGVISPDRTAVGAGGVTPANLWLLAREALALHGVTSEIPDSVGDDALLAVYGGITAQVVWLTGDRLATASVTSLDGDEEWVIESARSIALLLDRRLR
jgi:hypothetical protein